MRPKSNEPTQFKRLDEAQEDGIHHCPLSAGQDFQHPWEHLYHSFTNERGENGIKCVLTLSPNKRKKEREILRSPNPIACQLLDLENDK